MLQINNVSKSYGDFQAVQDLSLRVDGGEIVGLLGPNGAGKTTTIRCVVSILQPSSGTILVNGHDVSRAPEAAKQGMAYVPEVPQPYEMLSVWEHLRFTAAVYGVSGAWKPEGELLLRRLDLWDKKHDLAASLSKGLKQKLACACAFLHHPTFLCFDEPLIGIDPKGARELKNMLAERRDAGDAVLVSTHQLDTAERLCDRVVIMNRGRMVAQGTMDELHAGQSSVAGETLEDIFLRLTEEDAAPLSLESTTL